MSSSISWLQILLMDLLLAFGPAVIILFSKKASGKVKAKWFLYSVASVTLFPILLGGLMTAVTLIVMGKNRTDLVILEGLAIPIFILFTGWLVLYLFYKKVRNTNPNKLQN